MSTLGGSQPGAQQQSGSGENKSNDKRQHGPSRGNRGNKRGGTRFPL